MKACFTRLVPARLSRQLAADCRARYWRRHAGVAPKDVVAYLSEVVHPLLAPRKR